MTADQLEKVRRERWRQDGKPLLTLDDAEKWLEDTPLCLFLPRRAHLPVPAPSFVEAVEGKPDATPGPAAIAQAYELLARLVASGAVVPLNLFGTPGERPDFLATPEALSFIYALQTERNPKKAPLTSGTGKVSRLASEVWQLLEREGALTAAELRERLGREVTEAATLRALGELWHTLRVVPVPESAEAAAHWELLSARHRKELNSGSTQSQTTALSVLASFYLQSAVLASGEEVETFLSPLASRSRVRDVLRGLAATRQLGTLAMDAQTQYFLEGTLPEFAEEEEAARQDSRELQGLEGNEPDAEEAAASGQGEPARRPEFVAKRRSFTGGERPRPAAGDRGGRGARTGSPRTFGADRSRPRPAEGAGGGRAERPRSGTSRFGAPGGPRSFGKRTGAAGAGQGSAGGEDRPRRSFDRSGGDRPRTDRGAGGGAGFDRPRFGRAGSDQAGGAPGFKRTFRASGGRTDFPRSGAERQERGPGFGRGAAPGRPPRTGGERASGARPFRPAGAKPFGNRGAAAVG